MNQSSKIFVVALAKHRNFGHLLVPYLAEQIPGEPYQRLRGKVRHHDLNDTAFQLSPEEVRIVRVAERFSDEALLQRFSPGKPANEFQNILKKEEIRHKVISYIETALSEILELLKITSIPVYQKREKYCNLYEEDLISLCYHDTGTVFNFIRSDEETRYFLTLRNGSEHFSLLNKSIEILVNEPCRIYYQNKIYFFDHISASKLLPFREKEYISIPQKMEDRYYETFILNSIKSQEVNCSGFEIRNNLPEKKVFLSLQRDQEENFVLSMYFTYNGVRLKLKEGQNRVVTLHKTDRQFIFETFNREVSWENEKLAFVRKLGVNGPADGLKPGALLQENNSNMYGAVEWLTSNAEGLRDSGITISQAELSSPYYLGGFELLVNVENKIDWFDIDMMIRIGPWNIPFVRFKKHILSRLREFRLPDGEVFIIPETWFAKFGEMLSIGKTEANKIVVKSCHIMLLNEDIFSVDSALMEKIRTMAVDSVQVQEIPENLNAQLRNYQHDGYNWLFYLWQNRMNGCLADDMGLGKTLQTLVLLLKLKRSPGTEFFPASGSNGQRALFSGEEPGDAEHQPASLIVCPVSLLHNWENEIKKFTPTLKVYCYSGVKRREKLDLAKIIHQSDIILTTYGTVRNDADVLGKFTFFYLILDESQNIKNAESKSYRAVVSLQSRHRLVLTGTPIENSLSDLWSQLNFLNPGHLGSFKFFREKFLLPIEKERNPEVSASLNKLIGSFILRRTKEQVEEDLPPVMEETLTIQMTASQLELYESEKSSVRNFLLQNIDELDPRSTTFVVLQALTRLRQIAIHPRLTDQSSAIESGKFNEILSMLEILVAENHKILVFSSFVKHLNLLDEACRKLKWGFCRLTGQTIDRKSVIEEFQSENDKNIFLISLKAGGVGLNLTAADYIFIIDPWWNPASEMQAISRAHRIGQHKKVFVYRFISEKSIEEKIQLLQEKKAALANEFINRNDPFAIFGKEELISLFE